MKTVLTNVGVRKVGTIRRTTLNGRQYLVAPMTMIVPGVLAGSKGALYYPPQEVSREPGIWNGMPLVINHPVENGANVTARDPDILEKYGVGHVYKARIVRNRLRGEAWFDEDLLMRKAPLVYQQVLANKGIELSTGLFTDNYKAKAGATFNGKNYDYVARNYRADHLAILPDSKGACSKTDGCGVNVVNALPNQPRSLSTGKLKRMNAGTGKGEHHLAAQKGGMMLTDYDKQLGADIPDQEEGLVVNPAWVEDEATWEKAKSKADEGGYSGDEYWTVVAHIYQKMGGTVASTTNSNPEGYNQYTGGGGGGGGSKFQESNDYNSGSTTGSLLKGLGVDSKKGYGESARDSKESHSAVTSKLEKKGWTKVHDGERNGLRVTAHHKDGVEIVTTSTAGEKTNTGTEIHSSKIDKKSTTNSSFEGDRDMRLSTKQRKDIVSFLTTNCDCWKDKGEVLNKFDDEHLTSLKKARETSMKNEAVANAARETLTELGANDTQLTANAMPQFIKDKMAKKAPAAEVEEEDDEEEVPVGKKKTVQLDEEDDDEVTIKNKTKNKKTATANSGATTVDKPKNLDEWLDKSNAPDEVKEIVGNARQVVEDQKKILVNKLVAHVKDAKLKERLVANHMAKKLPQLRDEVAALPPTNTHRANPTIDDDLAPNYAGAGGGYTGNAGAEEEVFDDENLVMPTINYAAEVASRRKTGS